MTASFLLLVVLTTVFIYFCYRVYIVMSDKSFNMFLRRSRLFSKEQLHQLTVFETELKINTLVQNGLITQKQQTLLLQKLHKKSTVPDSFFQAQKIWFLGAGCILLGLIAIVAQNWFYISAVTKLCAYFALFFVLNILFLKTYFKNKKRAKIFALLNIGWIFIGIALIGQVFHLTGSSWSALFLGTVLSAPFVLATKSKHLLKLWALLFGFGAVLGTGQTYSPLFVLMMLPLVIYNKNNLFISLTWVVSFVFSFLQADWFHSFLKWYDSFFMPVAGSWILLCSLFAVLMGSHAVIGKCAFTKTLTKAFMVMACYQVFDIDYTYSFEKIIISSDRSMHSLWGLFIAAPFSFAAIGRGLTRHKKTAFNIWATSLFVAFAYSFIVYPPAGFILTLVFLIGSALYFILKNKFKAFNICLLLTVGRILLQYGDFTGSLVESGILFICIGCVLMLSNLFIKPFLSKRLKGAHNEK